MKVLSFLESEREKTNQHNWQALAFCAPVMDTTFLEEVYYFVRVEKIKNGWFSSNLGYYNIANIDTELFWQRKYIPIRELLSFRYLPTLGML